LLLVGEGDTVNTLERVIVGVSQEVGSGVLREGLEWRRCRKLATYFGDHECLDLTSVRDVRANTKVDHGTTSIDSSGTSVRYFRFDEILLVFVILFGLHISF